MKQSEFISKLEDLKMQHHYNDEDGWYSCPKNPEGCADDDETECNCGAEYHNKKVDLLIREIQNLWGILI